MTEEEDKFTQERLRGMLNGGFQLAGGAAAAAIGFLAGGPAGAAVLGAAGAAVSQALSHVGEEISQRLLGPREKMRVGGVLALAAARIKARIDAGEKVRSDGFFDEKVSGRSDAEEIAESVILRAQREAEEKKLPYMANLLANVVFEAGISVQMAHQISRTAESLTYRQLCILRLIPIVSQLGLRSESYRTQANFPSPLLDILYEVYDLERRGIIAVGGNAVLGLTDIEPSKLIIQGLGAHLYNLMRLSDIKVEEVMPIAIALR